MEVIQDQLDEDRPAETANLLLVTETLGAFAFNDALLSSVIDARARLLQPGATIIPQRVDLYLVPVEAPEVVDRFVNWWTKEPYGFNLSPLAVFASNVICRQRSMPPLSSRLRRWSSLRSRNSHQRRRVRSRNASTSRGPACSVDSPVGFRATLAPGIELTNEIPNTTSWSHVFLPLESPLAVEAGTPIDFDLETSDGEIVALEWTD